MDEDCVVLTCVYIPDDKESYPIVSRARYNFRTAKTRWGTDTSQRRGDVSWFAPDAIVMLDEDFEAGEEAQQSASSLLTRYLNHLREDAKQRGQGTR